MGLGSLTFEAHKIFLLFPNCWSSQTFNPHQQVLCQLGKSGIPSSDNIWRRSSCGGSPSHHSHGHPGWLRRGGRGLQKASKTQQGDQRQLGQAFDPDGSKDNPPSITTWIWLLSRCLVTSESTSKGDADAISARIGSRIIHQVLPTGSTTKCNLCHKSRHGMIVSKIKSIKWMYFVVVIIVDEKIGRAFYILSPWLFLKRLLAKSCSPVIWLSGSNQLCIREIK